MPTAQRLLMFTLAAAVCLVSADALAQSGSKKKPGSGAKPSVTMPVANTVEVGDTAPTVTLPDLSGQTVDLADTFAAGRTVLVVLRGYPGYQCGICNRLASGYIGAADQFADAGLSVVMVYPGESAGLSGKAEEFLGDRTLPAGVTMLLDPDYELVDAYGLRWDAPNETAYPSTFVIAEGGEVEWAKVSKTHGGRASAKAVLAAVTK
ncbi:MAG: redoxin family protein [Planctomycetota bacterium]